MRSSWRSNQHFDQSKTLPIGQEIEAERWIWVVSQKLSLILSWIKVIFDYTKIKLIKAINNTNTCFTARHSLRFFVLGGKNVQNCLFWIVLSTSYESQGHFCRRPSRLVRIISCFCCQYAHFIIWVTIKLLIEKDYKIARLSNNLMYTSLYFQSVEIKHRLNGIHILIYHSYHI